MASFDDITNSKAPQDNQSAQVPGSYATDFNQNCNHPPGPGYNRCPPNRYQPLERNNYQDDPNYGCNNMPYQPRTEHCTVNRQQNMAGPREYDSYAPGSRYQSNQSPCSNRFGNYPPSYDTRSICNSNWQNSCLPRLDYLPDVYGSDAPCRPTQCPPVKQSKDMAFYDYQRECAPYAIQPGPCSANIYRSPECDFRPVCNTTQIQNRNVCRDFSPRTLPQINLLPSGVLPCSSTPLEMPTSCRQRPTDMSSYTRHGSLICRPKVNFKCSEGYISSGRQSKESERRGETLTPLFPALKNPLAPRSESVKGRTSRAQRDGARKPIDERRSKTPQYDGKRSKTPIGKDQTDYKKAISEQGARIDNREPQHRKEDARLSPQLHDEGRVSAHGKDKSQAQPYSGKDDVYQEKSVPAVTQPQQKQDGGQSQVHAASIISTGQPMEPGQRSEQAAVDVDAQGRPTSSYETELIGSDRLITSGHYDEDMNAEENQPKLTGAQLKEASVEMQGEKIPRGDTSFIHQPKDIVGSDIEKHATDLPVQPTADHSEPSYVKIPGSPSYAQTPGVPSYAQTPGVPSYAQTPGVPSVYSDNIGSVRDDGTMHPPDSGTHHLQVGDMSQRSLPAPIPKEVQAQMTRRHTDQPYTYNIPSADEHMTFSQPMSTPSMGGQPQYSTEMGRPPSMYPSSDKYADIPSSYHAEQQPPPRSHTQPDIGRERSDDIVGTRSYYDPKYGPQQPILPPQGSAWPYRPDESGIQQDELNRRSQIPQGELDRRSQNVYGPVDGRSQMAYGQIDGRSQVAYGPMDRSAQIPQGEIDRRSQIAYGPVDGRSQIPQSEIDRRLQMPQGAVDKRSGIPRGAVDRRSQMPQGAVDRRSQFPQGAADRRSQIPQGAVDRPITSDRRPVPMQDDNAMSMKIKVSERDEYKSSPVHIRPQKQHRVNDQSTQIYHDGVKTPCSHEAPLTHSQDYPQRVDHPTVTVCVVDQRPKTVKDFTCMAGSPVYQKVKSTVSDTVCDQEIPTAQPRIPSVECDIQRRQRKTSRSTITELKEDRCQEDIPTVAVRARVQYDTPYDNVFANECALKRSYDSIACKEYINEQVQKKCYPPANKTFTPKSAYRMDYTIKPYSRRSSLRPGKHRLSSKSSCVSNRFDNRASFSGTCRFFTKSVPWKTTCDSWKAPEPKLENCTCYKRDFIAHSQPPLYQHQPAGYVRPEGKMSSLTTYRLHYDGAKGEKVPAFRPRDEITKSNMHDSYFKNITCAKQPTLDSRCIGVKQDITPALVLQPNIIRPQEKVLPCRERMDDSTRDNTEPKSWSPVPICTCTCNQATTYKKPEECIESESDDNQDFNRKCVAITPPQMTAPQNVHNNEKINEKAPCDITVRDCCLPEKKIKRTKCGAILPPMQSITNYRANFVAHGIPPIFHRQAEKYVRPEGTMDLMTTYRMHYEDVVASPVRPFLPKAIPLTPGVFSGLTSYRNDYINWHVPRTKSAKVPEVYVPPSAAFSGKTVYSEHFTTKCNARRKSKKANQIMIQSGPFDGRTTYNTVFVNHGAYPRRLPALPAPSRQESYVSIQKDCQHDDESGNEDISPILKQWSACQQNNMGDDYDSNTACGKANSFENKPVCICCCKSNQQRLAQRRQCTPHTVPFNSVEMMHSNRHLPALAEHGDYIAASADKIKKRRLCPPWNNNFQRTERPKSPMLMLGYNDCRDAIEMQPSKFHENGQYNDQPTEDDHEDVSNTQQYRDKMLNVCQCKNAYSNNDYSSETQELLEQRAYPNNNIDNCTQALMIEKITDYKEATVPSITAAGMPSRQAAHHCNRYEQIQPPCTNPCLPNEPEPRPMSTYRGEYKGWDAQKQQQKALTAAVYKKPSVPFSGMSVYREHFVPHPQSMVPTPVRHSDQFDLC